MATVRVPGDDTASTDQPQQGCSNEEVEKNDAPVSVAYFKIDF